MRDVREGHHKLFCAISAAAVVLASEAHAIREGRMQGEMSHLAYIVVYSVGNVEYRVCISLSTLAAAMKLIQQYKCHADKVVDGVFGPALTKNLLNAKQCPGELAFSLPACKTAGEVGDASLMLNGRIACMHAFVLVLALHKSFSMHACTSGCRACVEDTR